MSDTMGLDQIVIGGLYEFFRGTAKRRVVRFIRDSPSRKIARIEYDGENKDGPFRDDLDVDLFLLCVGQRIDESVSQCPQGVPQTTV